MGIKSLNNIIVNHTKNGEKKVHLSKFKGLRFAVDTNVYLYKYLYGKSNHIDGIFFMINKFKKFNITPLFIFDGKPPEEKSAKIKSRKHIRNKLEQKLLSLKSDLEIVSPNKKEELLYEIKNVEKKIVYVNRDVVQKTQKLFDLMGISYINADCEAEHYCSKLCRLNLVDGVVSEDTDTIACGSKLVLRQFSNKEDMVVLYNLDNILYDLEINYDSFIDLCILLGNDYNNRPRSLNPEKILKLIKEYKNIENILSNNIIYNLNFDFNVIRDIIKLKDVKPNIVKLTQQINKSPDIELLKEFLKNNSNIEENTYMHRISLMFKSHRKIAGYNYKRFQRSTNYIKNIEYNRYNPNF